MKPTTVKKKPSYNPAKIKAFNRWKAMRAGKELDKAFERAMTKDA